MILRICYSHFTDKETDVFYCISPCLDTPPSQQPSSTTHQSATWGILLLKLSERMNWRGSLVGWRMGVCPSHTHLPEVSAHHLLPGPRFLFWSLKSRSASLFRPQSGDFCCSLPSLCGWLSWPHTIFFSLTSGWSSILSLFPWKGTEYHLSKKIKLS